MLGWYVFKYSDDFGRTWSARRYRLPLPVASADRGNDWQGRVQMFWGIDKPTMINGEVIFGFTRLGRYLSDQGEGWFYRSDNLLAESDPEKIHWRLLPEGEHGLRRESIGSVQEEFNVAPLAGDGLLCFFRTRTGYAAQSYSRDGGRTWSEPDFAVYTPGGQRIKTPRACPMLWRTTEGKYLLWYHLNSPYAGPPNIALRNRNVAWLSAGTEKDGVILWSQPEVVCYVPERSKGVSYPDLIEANEKFFISATDKSEARVIELNSALLDGLWRQSEMRIVAEHDLALDLESPGPSDVPMPRLANLAGSTGGFAIELWLGARTAPPGEILLDSRAGSVGPGIVVTTTSEKTLRLELSDGRNHVVWDADAGVLGDDTLHHIVFNVDVAPRLITVIADGRVCDGGAARAFGFMRFGDAMKPSPRDVHDVSGSARLSLASRFSGHLRRLRLYTRYLTTSEAVGNFQAGPNGSAAGK